MGEIGSSVEFKARVGTLEVYMSSNILQLTIGSRDLSQAENKISVVTS